VGRVWPRQGGGGRPLNSVVRPHMSSPGYATIDSTITAWVKRNSFELFDSIEGMPEQNFRAVYLWSGRGECFQIWIDPPESGHVSVHARDIETKLDEEFRHDWRAPASDLEAMLETAVAQVNRWMERQ
jgi:hypothetical protein